MTYYTKKPWIPPEGIQAPELCARCGIPCKTLLCPECKEALKRGQKHIMTDEEISESYKRAARKKDQIYILADLNLCSPTEIRKVLNDSQ